MSHLPELLPPSSKAGSGLTSGLDHTHPADVLVRDWAHTRQAFDITLTPANLGEVSMRVGAADKATERRKHTVNNPNCAELCWVRVPLAVETYYNWGKKARRIFTLLAAYLAIGSHKPG